jgi:DNA repair exonuclease SbcCD ATPase subunit
MVTQTYYDTLSLVLKMVEEKQKRSLFPRQRPKPPPIAPVEDVSGRLNDLTSRLRVYEGRYSELRKNLVVIEQNMLSHYKKTNRELKDIYSEVSELRRQITEIQDNVTKIVKELGLLATKSDVKVLKRIIDYLDPIKFVRIDQVEKIVRDIIDEQNDSGENDEEEESIPKSL